MKKVVFVGSGPSKFNLSPHIPFVGSRSFKNLVKWIYILKPDYYITYNMNSIWAIKLLQENGFKVISLGNAANNYLDICGIESFKLPHPSPKNRMMNDQAKINQLLIECYKWLWEIT